MFQSMLQLAQQAAFDEWIDSNPFIVAMAMLVIGGALIGSGIWSLKSGKATGKWGAEYTGGTATIISYVRLALGVFCIGYSIYKMTWS